MTTIQGNTQTTKENSAWRELCQMTGELFAKFGARAAAFKAACARRPDLAATAIDPVGSPVIQGAVAPVASSSQGTRPAPSRASAVDDPRQSAIVLACEALAAASERRPDRNATPRGASGGVVGNASATDPGQSAVVKACEALAAASSQGTRQERRIAVERGATSDPLQRAVGRLSTSAER